MVAALWLGEISGPFLHLRDLLKEMGYRDTDLNLAIDVSSFKTLHSTSLYIFPLKKSTKSVNIDHLLPTSIMGKKDP